MIHTPSKTYYLEAPLVSCFYIIVGAASVVSVCLAIAQKHQFEIVDEGNFYGTVFLVLKIIALEQNGQLWTVRD